MIRLFSWREKKNFGDELSKDVVEWVSGETVQVVADKEHNKLLAVGSILQRAAPGDVIWGSGVHPYGFEEFWKNHAKKDLHLHVLAVRGPFTADVLRARGIHCPDVFGDPGVLTPLIYPKSPAPLRKVAVIPHLSEYTRIKEEAGKLGLRVINPSLDWQHVVDEIVSAERIISGSLHGLILADAYGVPSTWFRPTFYEGVVKFHDYYLPTGRIAHPVYTLEQAVAATSVRPPVLAGMQHALRAAFNKALVNEYCSSPPPTLPAGFYRVQTAKGLGLEPLATPSPLDTIVAAEAAPVLLNSAQPLAYRDHYPFTAGRYDAPAVVVSRLPMGYHTNSEGCRHNVAAGDGTLIYDSFSHMQQEDRHLLERAAASFAKVRDQAVAVDIIAASVVNQSTDNYFHWLLQSVPSIIAMRQISVGKDVSYIIGYNNVLWQNQSLELLGVRPEQILRAAPPVLRFKELYRPSPVNYIARNANIAPFVKKGFDTLLDATIGSRKKARKGRHVYVSRSDASLRKIENEQNFIDELKKFDFEIVSPGKLDLVQQIETFCDAEVILGTHGAGLTNLAFAPLDARVLEIFPGHYMDGSYCALTQIFGQNYRSYTQKNTLGPEAQGTHRAWVLDIPSTLKWLEMFTGSSVQE